MLKIKHSKIIIYIYRIAFFLLSFIPKNKKIIIFDSFSGRYYSDNPRAIYEYLKIHYPEYKMYWAANKHFYNNFENRDLNIIIRFTPNWLFLMCRAKYWVSNSRLPDWFYKSKQTVYLQTWHGTPLKKLALDMENVHIATHDTESYKKDFIRETSRWDYLISPNPYSTKIFKQAFSFHQTMLEVGYPRNDFLINNSNEKAITRIKKINHLPANKKIILYAPTWRDHDYEDGQFIFNLQLDFKKLQQAFGEDYIVLLRLHYNVTHHIDLTAFNNFVYDFSNYDDIRELYLIADVLITDYSSVFFDYSILQRPIIFFMYDLELYRDTLRGFYFNIEETCPHLIAKTNDELLLILQKITSESLNDDSQIFQQFIELEDGATTKRVVEKVFLDN